jgi:predicted RNA binding protein YcfA (HicA-like mRNA interferase family)
VKGDEFLRRVKDAGRRHSVEVRFESRHGKGSHGRLYYGEKFTTVKDRKQEIGPGLLLKMLRDLGLARGEIF